MIAEVDHDPLIGAIVGHYTIDGFVGEGGMGRVYRAHHTLLANRRVALKVLLGDLAATLSMRMRFTHEAEAASSLDHPNVVSVIDFGRTEQGLLYLAMEFVDGRPLSSLIEEGPMEPARVIALARQMAAGLEHAHARGFVHRDFKPDNVLIVATEFGEVPKIVDFGLAISFDPSSESPRFTTVGLAVGTPAYASPEQAYGRTIDHRADLFALGITMFEMLAGTVPYDGNVSEVVLSNASGPVPRISDRAPNVRAIARLEALVRALMSPAANDRPQSVREVIAELDRIDADPPDTSVQLKAPAAPLSSLRVAELPASPTTVTRARRAKGWWLAVPVVIGLGAVVGFALLRREESPRNPRENVATAAPPSTIDAGSSTSSVRVEPAAIPEPPPVGSNARGSAASEVEVEVRGSASPTATRRGRVVESTPRAPERLSTSDASDAGVGPPIDGAPPMAATEQTVISPDVASESKRDASNPIEHEEPAGGSAAAASPVAKPPPPSIVATTADVVLERLEVRGSLTTTTVRRALDRARPALRACWGPAVRAAGRSPAIALATELVIDEHQLARGVRVGASSLPGLTACVAGVLGTVRSESAPDVGTVTVRVIVRYTPEEP